MKSKTRYINYSEENDEPEDHIAGKERIRTVLEASGFILISNTDKFEYKLPELYNDIGDQKRNYTLDCLMYSPSMALMIIVEVQGASHYGNVNTPKVTSKKKEANMRLKEEMVSTYFRNKGAIKVDKQQYFYNGFKYFSIKTSDLMMINAQQLRHKLLY